MTNEAETPGFIFKEKALKLEEALKNRHPTMPSLLQDIHRTLKQYPECVTLATEEEIATIIQGLKIQTGVEFVSSFSKGPGKKAVMNDLLKRGMDAL